MKKYPKALLRPIWKVAIVSTVLIVFGLVLILLTKKSGEGILPDLVGDNKDNTSDQVAIKDMPFAELTIPYLRAKSYNGRLGQLVQESDKTEYASYLTNYDSDGLRIDAQLTVPKGTKPAGGWPGVVFVHGYIAPTTYTTLGKYVDYVDYLAANGLVVLKIDLRGHGKSEGEAGGSYYSGDYVVDTLNAYNAISMFGEVNPSKVGLWGHSMAGNVLMRSIAVKKDIPVAVIWAGAGYTYSDLRQYRLNDSSYRPPDTQSQRQKKRGELFGTYGEFSDNSEFWRSVAPTNYLNEITTAIQLNHAVDDEVVSVEYSRNLNTLLDKTNLRHEFYEYPSGGHNISGASFGLAMRNTVKFLTQY